VIDLFKLKLYFKILGLCTGIRYISNIGIFLYRSKHRGSSLKVIRVPVLINFQLQSNNVLITKSDTKWLVLTEHASGSHVFSVLGKKVAYFVN